MSYDPCGSRKLEGEDILRLLADKLGVSPHTLEGVLVDLLQRYDGNMREVGK